MGRRALLPVLILLAAVPRGGARAGVSVGAVYAPTYTLLAGNTGGLGAAGGGLLVAYHFGKTAVQLNALYETQVFSGMAPSYLDAELEVSRALFLPRLSIGAGAYTDFLIAAGGAPVVNVDYGLVGGAMYSLPLSFFSFLIGLNYKFALSNANLYGNTRLNLVEVLIGLRIGGGSPK